MPEDSQNRPWYLQTAVTKIPTELDGGLMKQPRFICNLAGWAERLKNLVTPII